MAIVPRGYGARQALPCLYFEVARPVSDPITFCQRPWSWCGRRLGHRAYRTRAAARWQPRGRAPKSAYGESANDWAPSDLLVPDNDQSPPRPSHLAWTYSVLPPGAV